MVDPKPLASEGVTETPTIEPSLRTEANEESAMTATPQVTTSGEEQALESHEVIELQTFSERKVWIEEKIRFLEALPPIEVFVGLDSLRTSSEDVPGLPTRTELEKWMAEHDSIEKETEIFDTGELKKLRQLTKAATQRNLSPEDTDVIELTLTTIYALDKLLHLLRDRSEHLEMMSIRLLWEENRRTSWRERRQIIEDLQAFSINRARWNPSIYESTLKNEESNAPLRRGSIASQISQASINSETSVNSPAFSRAARFKLAELLSRDAAQFSGRVTSLKHGKVAAAGKALDKLIDHSRKPVPDDLLDEQDRVEEKCINEMETIGKFTMQLVMQWRKADEIYVETMKDHTSASNLLEEIETAKLYHPTNRQSISFSSRIDTILKRLAVRGDPSSPTNLFPRPEHFLFPDQKSTNDSLVQSLSKDIAEAITLAKTAEFAAKEYKTTYDAVKRVETLLQSVDEISTSLAGVNKKFREGVSGGDSDGSPPDLMLPTCLDPNSHSVFLALLPSLVVQSDQAISQADQCLQSAPSALMQLETPGIDQEFKENANIQVNKLAVLRAETSDLLDSVSRRVARLRESRKISTNIDSKLASLKATKMQIIETIEQDRWRQESGGTGAPLTPESSTSGLHRPESTYAELDEQLSQVDSRIKPDIHDPLDNLCATLEHPLEAYLTQKVTVLRDSLHDGRQLLQLLSAIREQSLNMTSIRDEFYDIISRIEDKKIHITDMIEEVLEPKSKGNDSNSDFVEWQPEVGGIIDLDLIKKEAAIFVNGLSERVRFVAGHPSSTTRINPLKSPPLSGNFYSSFSLPDQRVPLPVDLASLDAGVRADSNSYVMRVNGSVDALVSLKAHLELAEMAKAADSALSSALADTNQVEQELSSQRLSFVNMLREVNGTIDQLQTTLGQVQHIRERRSEIARSLSPLRQLLRQMDEKSKPLDSASRKKLYKSRVHSTDDLELRLNKLDEEASSFIGELKRAQDAEREHQEALRIANALRIEKEKERIAAEEAERLRLEQERLEMERQQRLFEEKMEEERRQELERERQAFELAENQRIEQEGADAEKRRLEELEERAAQAQAQEKQEQLARQDAERIQFEQERLDVLEKLRLAQAQLDEERRLHAERESATLELTRKQQAEMDELTKRQAQIQGLVEEHARRADAERAGKERAEREAREHEEELLKQHSEIRKLTEAGVLQAELNGVEMVRAEQAARQRADTLEKQHIDALKLAEEHARQTEIARAEKVRAEEEAKRLAAELERQTVAKDTEKRRLAEEHLVQLQSVRAEKELAETIMKREVERNERTAHNVHNDADVFGIRAKPMHRKGQPSQDLTQIQTQILALRKRLRSIGISETLHPSKASTHLPTEAEFKAMNQDFSSVSAEVKKLPHKAADGNLDVELRSLREEVEESHRPLKEIQKLADMHTAVQACDEAMSDLLEHIDSYPAVPLILSSKHNSAPSARPEEQLLARIIFTKELVEDMESRLAAIPDDHRAISEHSRIQQTWSELHDMANDRISGKKSRPTSVISRNSSGRDSSASANPPPSVKSHSSRKVGSYANLSVSSVSSKGKMLAPPVPQAKPRRVVTATQEGPSRSVSRVSSASTTRSVSGPMSNSSLFGSTYASRQRTTSLSSNSTSMGPPSPRSSRRPSLTPSRLRVDSESKRGISPALTENSHSSLNPSRSSINPSTWSRAPRDSFSSILPRVMTPHKKSTPQIRKKYVADPKSKLDVAVGEVVNQLPVGINIEGITESWRDQSGKYWIGNQDPKLCFCRILRSQTVMVRVGGGWTELSRFIKDHFAESFRIAPGPESPPRLGAKTETWISSATLINPRESLSPPPHPRTPEPSGSFIPSFSLVTPSGQSPKSLKSLSPSSNMGSPLTPLQFIRRVEPDLPLLRPASPSKTPFRGRTSTTATPARSSVWRP